VKDVLAYLRLAVNPLDAMSLRRIVNTPPRGIGRATVERALRRAEEEGVPLLEGLRRAHADGSLGRSGSRVGSFLELLDGLVPTVQPVNPAEGIARVLDRTGYLAWLEREGTPEAEARVENLRELLAGADDFEAANAGVEDEHRSPLELFLDQVALVSDLDEAELRTERVSLMTAHSAKGLEFPVVFLVGMEEGIFPHSASSNDRPRIEEERRLCYVGMTRAMECLVLTCASERRRFGSRTYGVPSRFLTEIPTDVIEGQIPAGRSEASGLDRTLDYSYDQSAPGEMGVARGMRVQHPIFGGGTVLEVSGRGAGQKLRIRFDRAGVKTILVRYANLEFG
jgi:DNA helicase-2/ATP-dependent DNA helicase PcrA